MSFLAAPLPGFNGLSLDKGLKIEWARWTACQAKIDFVLESGNSRIPLLNQTQPFAHDFAC